MMDLSRRKGKNGYPNIEVVYANDDTEAAYLLQGYMRQGYLMNSDVRDVNRLAVVIDERYYYDEDSYLRTRKICEMHMRQLVQQCVETGNQM